MVLFVALSLSIALGLVVPALHANRIAEDSLQSKQSYFIAESGVEDVLYRLQTGKQLSTSETLVLGTAETTTTVTTVNLTEKQITSVGDAKDRNRSVSVTVSQGAGASFQYGLQAGRGGVSLQSGSIVGNVYSNGPITANNSGSNSITGTAISATVSSPSANQQNDGASVPLQEIHFGGSVDWQTNYPNDVAQSFQVSESNSLSNVRLYIKRSSTAWMNNVTVRITGNSGGNPGTTIASATLEHDDVGTSYSYISIPFGSTPTLTPGNTYWIVLDTGSTYGSYYTIGATSNTYANGLAKVGTFGGTWSATTPSGLDGYFGVFMGGITGLIDNIKGGGIGGDARAYTVSDSIVTGTIHCQSGTGNNKACITTSPIDEEGEWPVSENAIASWEEKATLGTTTTGNVIVGSGTTVNMGPRKIVGNLTVTGGATLVLDGTLWVTGMLTINGGSTVKLASGYGATSDAVLVNGRIALSGGGTATGSGTTGSYILLVSQSTASNAISQDGGSGAVILVAQNGTVSLTGGVSAKQVTGYEISISGGSSVTYESGIANLNFSSGPSGSWNIDSWKEI